ncbi:dTDP-4-dehydrorhamnose reductase [Flavobacterium sp. F372]|uniref:dTDP-4-dehydrorhamnose reductase n=1 Tax=Flavobacterium bernardetii TaxID=2813823 RepID=A0ABR7IYK1_9FLAO|nr:dTDP-4-dehydrorhamnose reductase [Flavobacterium bernardetii]MBC5834854.1 dTDP-4-dehydrorhamnose reductase [Flavobacterium bernardetii]NHF70593.1 dTDP-4-dehydrorhamnose reductase [Flavobacterium bernardetii]
MVVLVTGANGQLGQAIQSIVGKYPSIDFVFCTSAELDITNNENCKTIFETYKPQFCINAAAYTAVDKAESEPEKAVAINVTGAKNLAEVCKSHDTILLHVSTDFVFDGLATKPYSEEDLPNPTGVYGQTKLDGEKAIQQSWKKHYIVRTSWVYSQFANNFMKTMLRLASERDSLSVVSDQIGTPTNAVDLAEALLKIITSCHDESVRLSGVEVFGIYNFSNEGQCSWYDFAAEIFKVNNISIKLNPIPSSAYPTPAKRPAYSVLDKSKIKEVFGIEIKNWEESLKKF